VEEYLESEPIDITTIGMSGIITMNSTNLKSLDQLQFGVSIMQCDYPFAKTVIITIVPRYQIVNKLTYPVKVRQIAANNKLSTICVINNYEHDF
jgi:hypothetical protein